MLWIGGLGLYDVEYRILVACRDGSLCYLKRGWPTAKVRSDVKKHFFLGGGILIRYVENLKICFFLLLYYNPIWTYIYSFILTCLCKHDIDQKV